MRSWLLMARVAVVGVVAALVVVSDGSAAPKVVTVAITAAGASPSTVTVSPMHGAVLFVNHDSVAHTVVLRQNAHARYTCPLGAAGEPPSGSDQCTWGAEFVSRHPYTVDGRPAGTVVVMGIARAVSLTAGTHAVRLGSQLKLHGRVTFDDAVSTLGASACTGTFTVFVLARHDRSQPFKRIAILPERPSKARRTTNNECFFGWQLSVRPGVATTYIAKVTDFARIWRVAISRPFTVLIGP